MKWKKDKERNQFQQIENLNNRSYQFTQGLQYYGLIHNFMTNKIPNSS